MRRDARIRLGDHVLDPATRSLRSSRGESVTLRPKAYATLTLLLQRAPALVTKDEIIDRVWDGAAVSDSVLKVCIRELRQALGDDPRAPRYIETRHRIGYRLVASMGGGPWPGGEMFVGRRKPLQRLHDLLGRVRSAKPGPRVVVVQAEPGMGKTCLARAFLDEASRAHPELSYASGGCAERETLVEPLAPLLESLADAAGREPPLRDALARHAPTWCRELGIAAADRSGHSPAMGPGRMLRELAQTIRAVCAQTPLVWVVEDLHWADASSLEVLGHLARRCAQERLLVIATRRPSVDTPLERSCRELVAGGYAEALTLEPFDDVELGAFLDRSLGAHALEPAWVDAFRARTEGHPLFVARLLEHLQTTGSVERDEAGRVVSVGSVDALQALPQSVESAIERKLADLDAESLDVLMAASPQGNTFFLDPLVGSEQARMSLEARLDTVGRNHRLVHRVEGRSPGGFPEARYRFSHGLVREALYRRLGSTRRAGLHRDVAAWLEARHEAQLDPQAATIAHHLAEAGEIRRALSFIERAAGHAERLTAVASVDAVCSRALSLVSSLPAPERAAAELAFHRRRASVRLAAGRFDAAEADLERMREAASEVGDTRAEIDALLLTFRQNGYLGRFDEALVVAGEAEALARRRGDATDVAQVRGSVASLQGVRGQLVEAEQGLTDALAALDDGEGMPLRFDRGTYRVMRADYGAALDDLAVVLPWAEGVADGLRVTAGLMWRGLALANLGRVTEGMACWERALQCSEQDEDLFVRPRIHAAMGWVHRTMGDAAQARRWSERALEAASAGGPEDARVHALLGLALDEAQLGVDVHERLAEAQTAAERAFFSDWLVHVRSAGVSARLALVAGDARAAVRHAEAWLERARTCGLRKHEARAKLALALGAHLERRDEEADARIAELERELAAYPMPLFAWRLAALAVSRGADRSSLDEALARLCARSPASLGGSLRRVAARAVQGRPAETAAALA